MSWEKREPVSNLVVLGDGEGNVKRVGGLLFSVVADGKYPDRNNYRLVQQDGTVLTLAGSASLNNQIHAADVGRFVKCEFMGWGKSANGRFKDINVLVWTGEPNDAMKAWPKYDEAQKNADTKPAPAPAPAPDYEDAVTPEELDSADPDDLPF